jgi:hypothetical protein
MERENFEYSWDDFKLLIGRKVNVKCWDDNDNEIENDVLFEIIDFELIFEGFPVYEIDFRVKLKCLDDKQTFFPIEDFDCFRENGRNLDQIKLIEDSFDYERTI